MKIQNIFRMQAIVIGFAAALLLASSTPAQEIENTNWDDGPNAVPFAQPAPAATPNDLNSAAADSHAASTAAVISEPIVNQEAAIAQRPPVEGGMIAFLLVCIAVAVLYGLVEAKRGNRNRNGRARQVNSRAALS
jgi:hypothetical protein